MVDDALSAGARAIVVLSAGLGETGEDGARREEAVRDRVRAAGAVLMGPNCLGVFDAAAELEINNLTHGSIGVVSQSGNFALELNELAADHELGISRFASLGNQADLEFAEVIADLARHEPTRLIAVYCEDFRDGRAFADRGGRGGRTGQAGPPPRRRPLGGRHGRRPVPYGRTPLRYPGRRGGLRRRPASSGSTRRRRSSTSLPASWPVAGSAEGASAFSPTAVATASSPATRPPPVASRFHA